MLYAKDQYRKLCTMCPGGSVWSLSTAGVEFLWRVDGRGGGVDGAVAVAPAIAGLASAGRSATECAALFTVG